MKPSAPQSGGSIAVKIDQAQAPIHIHLSEKEKSSQPPPLSAKFDLSRLPKTDSALFGREDELALIDQAWQEDGLRFTLYTGVRVMKTFISQLLDVRLCKTDPDHSCLLFDCCGAITYDRKNNRFRNRGKVQSAPVPSISGACL